MTDSSTVFLLTKLAPLLLYPIGTVIVLNILGIILMSFRPRLGLAFFGIAVTWLWMAAMPAIATWAVATLEHQYPARPVNLTPKADVAIVLAGGVGHPAPPRVDLELTEASDRVLQAVRLYDAGRVDRILVTGGILPWASQAEPEAELMRSLLIDWGVPANAVLVEGKSRNTYEHALQIKEMHRQDPFDSALLITSAAHMPRAMAVFKKAGIPVTASATDIVALKDTPSTPLRWLPSASALALTTATIKEWLGFLAYQLRGYV